MNTHEFGSSAIGKLVDKIEYELWLLEAIYTITNKEPFTKTMDFAIYPLSGSKVEFINRTEMKLTLFDWRPHFLEIGAPLIFVTTFKILDMLIEWIFEINNTESNWRFEQKKKKLSSDLKYPQFFIEQPWLKDRIVEMYKKLEPYRSTILHKKNFQLIMVKFMLKIQNGMPMMPR